MSKVVAECNARTDADVRVHAEKAAFKGETLRVMFNSLQARTAKNLSPETRVFAEVCYEKHLTRYIAAALIECAKSDKGRETADEIVTSQETSTLKGTWKPLVDRCSKLLRNLKMETTNARLSRLSDHWSRSEEGARQARRLKDMIWKAIHTTIDEANIDCEKMVNWIELYSVPHSPIRKTYPSYKDLEHKRNIVKVHRIDAFSEAAAFIERETAHSIIHVIVGDEDSGARFYISIFDRFKGILLKWRNKMYGEQYKPKIVIATRAYFASEDTGINNREAISSVFLHTETIMDEPFNSDFERGSLNDYLREVFVLTEITMKHYKEIQHCIKHHCGNLLKLIKSWPSEKQILDDTEIMTMWNYHCDDRNQPDFIDNLLAYIEKSIEAHAYLNNVQQNFSGYVTNHGATFVQSSITALSLELGQDYVVYSERSSSALTLKVRMKKSIDQGFGMQQFLEMRHGCVVTPYRILKAEESIAAVIQSYNNVLIVQRSNPYTSLPSFLKSGEIIISQIVERCQDEPPKFVTMTIEEFPCFVSTATREHNSSLLIVVCPTTELMNEINIKMKAEGKHACICETPLGVTNESGKNTSETLVVCTTSACFEGWQFLPHLRVHIKIIVFHHANDYHSLKVAYYLADSTEIENVCVYVPNGGNRTSAMTCSGASAIPSRTSQSGKAVPNATSKLSNGSPSEKELIEQLVNTRGINDLLEAKRLLHRRERNLSVAAKIVNASLPSENIESADSPMDISSNGFLKQSRNRISETIRRIHGVEVRILTCCSKYNMHDKSIDQISERSMISPDELKKFVRSIKTTIHWTDLRDRIAKYFQLEYDAENHWSLRYGNCNPRADRCLIALSSDSVSAATSFLEHLRLSTWPVNYRTSVLQCSDRNLDDCTMYHPESELNEELQDTLLKTMEGALTIEYVAPASSDNGFAGLSPTSDLLGIVVADSSAKGCPLYLFPRRCYDRLASDLLDYGVVICKDYEHARKQKHIYDTIQLPLINETTRRSSMENLLRVESALMEYGSRDWMEWLARRLRFYDYDPEVISFYHRTVAERDYYVQDERLIQRLREALTNSTLNEAESNADKMRINAFVYSTMDILLRGDRLVLIEPPFASTRALTQLTDFIRARRMPPPDFQKEFQQQSTHL
ncbi:hypothetical protein PENTCL1PPCAC_19540 [Pristionchus entomophagus]|uniref:Uncharacterized protein n=1 Tax=Pristionchus entomophagus TaxID=358040 RepID=A0AAV5TSV9_9BILA|nr:hypothetical protein PENTCL1PPCAC_19540 [Pristionchus entomophagus]